MNRKVTLVLLITVLICAPAFAQLSLLETELSLPLFYSVSYYGVAVPGEDAGIPEGIRNNQFYLESLRLTKLAYDTYEYGDYDASSGFANEAIRFAMLSDEFVSAQLIAETKRLLDWADANDIPTRYASSYNDAKNFYEAGVAYHAEEEWNDSIYSTTNAIGILSAFQGRTVVTTVSTTTSDGSRQYTVRTWAREKDCLWNISAYPQIYGTPWRWRTIYEANKSKMPDPNNPDLIVPGMVLDIPR